ncbi:Histone gene expression regulation protein [Komagataella phaffii CBS 7435]|uniref:Protein that localizes to chromatin and has a role in regulation of histone gene expression n=2 Tax=Komagataella phaffii TaxID=460519 RepID=C4R0J8_KOMPG|nr:Protein that localizes to chromatin and has a role in regulation of histone gene expression [Komagataella phaffii GS115]AOA63071.1 GQ67_00442T0 [Komagataella phaffii]CAH2448460.1 Histone gene expression regulation protein [Komagataella phaffii CBS 7435]AOA67068.1 GQ68_00947T0 [Komagataella phaffii GS115]CAY69022.1 Protein that localizes to chromatin and has a role in regulation of histone gene expression [Komagataella phaffii GS115]CCA38580.1 Histone gene expression regulation protein [Koma
MVRRRTPSQNNSVESSPRVRARHRRQTSDILTEEKHSNEEDEILPPRRKKQKVNYNEDAIFDQAYQDQDDDDGGDKLTNENVNENGHNDPTENTTVQVDQTDNNVKNEHSDKESEYNDSEDYNGDDQADSEFDGLTSEEERFAKRKADEEFIVKDDFDYDDSKSKGRRRARRTRSSRSKGSNSQSRKSRRQILDSEEEEDDANASQSVEVSDHAASSIQQELEDLKDSPPNTPPSRKLNLRNRKNVDYTIPPPLANEITELVNPPTPKKRAYSSHANRLKRLFPTVGPFGGSDVTSIFGQNVPGLTALNNDSSSSSEDEIAPINSKSNRKDPNAKFNTGPANMGKVIKSKKNSLADSDPLGVDMNIDFTSVGGLDNYINQLKEMVMLPLLYPEVYTRFHITPPRGVLFHGPPGTGKTLMARALAASCSTGNTKVTFFMRKGADCLSKWVGEAERQLRLLFEEAKNQQPSIIFFDEIDGLAPVRSSKQEQIHASIVSTLLALMDGMDNRGQVIVIGATNRPDSVDPALRRPGRFDREFYFPLPDLRARKEILQIQTKNWSPPLEPTFVEKLAELTKGYGGSDLRALCTEAALNSIQRKYPQVYQSQLKLQIDPSKIEVSSNDFMLALEKIIPSSARSIASPSNPLPKSLESLLKKNLDNIIAELHQSLPTEKRVTLLEDSQYVDYSSMGKNKFDRQELIQSLKRSRVYKPRLLISGGSGMGQIYLGPAILHHMEGYHVQSLDLGTLYNDSSNSSSTLEAVIVQKFMEAKKHKPSIVIVPSLDIWFRSVPDTVISTISALLRSADANDQLLILGLLDSSRLVAEEKQILLDVFEFKNVIELKYPDKDERRDYFEQIFAALNLKPIEFNEIDTRPRRKLRDLPQVQQESTVEANDKSTVKQLEKLDMRLKNMLKIKLSALMELFKQRYKRFRKPTIDDSYLVHLFHDYISNIHPEDQPYQRDGDMILEVATGKKFYNMDLDVIEERIWNGFYSEPKQFLKDVEMIYRDAREFGERERLLKASEMFANAQVGIEEIGDANFIKECKMMHARETERQRKYLQQSKNQLALDQAFINVHTDSKPEEAGQEDSTRILYESQQAETAEPGINPTSNSENLVPSLVEDTFMATSTQAPEGDQTVLVEDSELPGGSQNQLQAQIKPPNGIAVSDIFESTELLQPPLAESTKDIGATSASNEESVLEAKGETNSNASEPPNLDPDSGPDIQEFHARFNVNLEYDQEYANRLKELLVNKTVKFNIDQLQEHNSQLTKIIWDDRKQLNKKGTLTKIEEYINRI